MYENVVVQVEYGSVSSEISLPLNDTWTEGSFVVCVLMTLVRYDADAEDSEDTATDAQYDSHAEGLVSVF